MTSPGIAKQHPDAPVIHSAAEWTALAAAAQASAERSITALDDALSAVDASFARIKAMEAKAAAARQADRTDF